MGQSILSFLLASAVFAWLIVLKVESFGIQLDHGTRLSCMRSETLAPRTILSESALSESASSSSTSDLDQKLMDIGRRLKLTVLDLDDGTYTYDSRDNRFGIEVVHSRINLPAPSSGESLGLELTELASSTSHDGRGLVLISDVFGAAASPLKEPEVPGSKLVPTQLKIGDVLTGVRVEGTDYHARLTELDYDLTVEAIGRAKEAANKLVAGNSELASTSAVLNFEADRLVERAPVTVEIVEAGQPSSTRSIDSLAGENLRQLLLRKGVNIYNPKTKRLDMPYATGDCAGEGLCGTCLVKVIDGMDVLSPKDDLEELILQGRPVSWRASCRCVVGYENKPGTVRIQTQPQTGVPDEIDPGVRFVHS